MKGVWVRAELRGLNLERLISAAAEAGVQARSIDRRRGRLSLRVMEQDLPQLRAACEAGGWSLQVKGRTGCGRWLDALRRRWVLAAAALLALLCAVHATGYVWRIDVRGAGRYEPDLRACLEAWDIRPGQRRSEVDTAALREKLEWRYPKIAWAECGFRGTCLRITLVEGVQHGEPVDAGGPGDVVASRAGIVRSVITLAGTPRVAPGELVQAGQVLIAGEERGADGTLHPVMARGEVIARVWDSAAVRISCTETETVYTGRWEETLNVRCPWFALFPETAPDYPHDRSVTLTPLGGFLLPLTLQRTVFREAETVIRRRPDGDVRSEAAEAALRALHLGCGADDVFIDKWVDYCMIEGEILEAVATGERRVDIASPLRGS